jgi:hypothetical protein
VRRLAVALILCALALPVSAADAWTWPVDGPLLRSFSFDQAHPYAGGQHRGLDIGAPTGTNVVAPAEGVVSFAGTVPTGGKTVSILTPFGYTATLVHLGSIGVTRGASVDEGSVVGTVGPSGTVDLSEPYVYFGVRRTSDQQGYVDPLTLLPPRPLAEPRPAATASGEAPAADVAPAAAEVHVTPAASAPEPAAASPADAADPAPAQPVPLSAPAATAARAASEPSGQLAQARSGAAQARPKASEVQGAVAALKPAAPAKLEQPAGDARPRAGTLHHRRYRAHEHVPGAGPAQRPSRSDGRQLNSWLPAVLGALALALVFVVALRRAGRKEAARIMSIREPKQTFVGTEATAQDPGGASLALCVGETSSGPRGGVRRAGRHLRALPPPEGQRRLDGERHRRTRHAGDGHGGSRGRLAA